MKSCHEVLLLSLLSVQPEPLGAADGGAKDNAIARLQGEHSLMEECPGQDFQVPRLFTHLTHALGPASDVLLDEYLSSWEELIK